LHYPTSDVFTTWSGDGLVCSFQGGAIWWSQGTGAHEVHGAILTEYASLNWDYGFLKYPTSDEMNVPGVPGARMNTFQGGAVYWSQGTGAHEVHGDIGALYQGMGGPTSYLGLPISDEQGIPGGRVSHFQHGKILWSPDGGAHAVQTQSQLSWTESLTTDDGTPVGGWAQLTVYADGSYNFTGHVHDSGFPDYNYGVVLGLVSPSGVLYTFAHTGHVTGTDGILFGGSRDDDWDVSGTNPALAAGWADLQGCNPPYARLAANWDLGGLIQDIERVAQIVGTVVSIVG
jgi:uncharacterized protein with LGFP repeats